MTHRQVVDGAARERLVRRFGPGASSGSSWHQREMSVATATVAEFGGRAVLPTGVGLPAAPGRGVGHGGSARATGCGGRAVAVAAPRRLPGRRPGAVPVSYTHLTPPPKSEA